MNPPANWYPDPTGRHGQRYWDGEQWTEHVFTDGIQDVDPLDAVGGTAASGDEDTAGEDTTGQDTTGDDTTGDDTTGDDTAATGTATVAPDDVAEDEADTASEEQDVAMAEAELSPTSAGDAAAPGLAPLPRRRRPGASDAGPAAERQAGDQADAPLDEADGLFAETTSQAPDADLADTGTRTWTPEDAFDEEADEPVADVAPDVEPQDVVASVGEVTDPDSSDFSDAFILAPETASRLVGRGDRPQADDDTSDEEDRTAADTPDEADTPPAAEAEAEDDGTAGALVDAPPPAMPTPDRAHTTGLGISGDLVGGAFAEREGDGPVALQNSRMLRCAASGGIIARQGTMVAYQGDVQFERQGAGGVGRALKRAATGEGLAMMRVSGDGDVFFADAGQHVFLLELDGGSGLSVNGRNVLAFSASLQWDIDRVKGASLLAGGLFNTTLTGSGWVALVSDGEPVVLRTDESATHVDVNALVAWSAGLSTRVVNTVSAKSLVGLGSGEAFQMAFDGAGIVIVQPSEGPTGGSAGN